MIVDCPRPLISIDNASPGWWNCLMSATLGNPHGTRCMAKTVLGKPCKNSAKEGHRFCWLHCLSRTTNARWYQNSVVQALVAVVLAIFGIIATWYYGTNGPPARRESAKAAMAGALKVSQSGLVISAGGARFAVCDPNGVFLTDGSIPLVWLRRVNGKLMLSANIRNEKGELIAELKDNEWGLNKDLIFDRNYTDLAVEVRERSGRVVLQVANLGDVVYFAAILRCQNGREVGILNENGNAIFRFSGSQEKQGMKIIPIFEYPSERHLGSCPGYETLRTGSPARTNASQAMYMLTKPLNVCR